MSYEKLNERINQLAKTIKKETALSDKGKTELSEAIQKLSDIRYDIILNYEKFDRDQRTILYEKLSLTDRLYEDASEVTRTKDIEWLRKQIEKENDT